jgi:DNA invertase Pin-like site-specific DNA recombinase
MANVRATFAQFERRLIGQRTRGLAAKKARGERLGRARDLPDEIVERIVRERESGATLEAIAASLNDEAVATARRGVRWYPSTITRVLGYARPDLKARRR